MTYCHWTKGLYSLHQANRPKRSRRRRAIVTELSRLSRNGWSDARPNDYLPLESELRAIRGDKR